MGFCMTGNGGVFLLLCSIKSNARSTFLPSTKVSGDQVTNVARWATVLEATPLTDPGSSPVLLLNSESFKHTGLPSILTDLLPFAVSLENAKLGNGTGGVPGAGILQTSGKQGVMPPLSLCTTDLKFTPTVTGIVHLYISFLIEYLPIYAAAPVGRLLIAPSISISIFCSS